MKVKLLGVRPVNFPDKDTGEMVEGLSLYIAFPDPDVYGLAGDKKFVSNSALERLKVSSQALITVADSGGAEIDIDLNPRGKLSAITILK